MSLTLRELFIKNLKFYRQQKNFTQASLSSAVGKSLTYINGIENFNSFPQPEMIEKIANTLKIKPYLLFIEDELPIKTRYSTEVTEYLKDIEETAYKALKKGFEEGYSTFPKD